MSVQPLESRCNEGRAGTGQEGGGPDELAVPDPGLLVGLEGMTWRISHQCWQNSWCKHEEKHLLRPSSGEGDENLLP